MDDDNNLSETLITLTADIVSAHVSNNSVSVNDLPQLISNVHGALSGLGIILQSNGDRKQAYEVFRKALAVNPFLADVKKAVQSLEGEVGETSL